MKTEDVGGGGSGVAVETTTAAENKKIDALAKIDATGLGFESAGNFALLQRAGQLLASSTLVPKEYQGNLPNCVIALNMATRIGADPLMVMQNLYVVHGRPGWSAQFLIATFNQNGRFTALRYEWVGEKGTETWGCRAWSIEKATGEKLSGSTVTLALAKAEGWTARNGSKWQTMPDQMLMYRSAAWFIRAYAPEIAMGLHTVDELDDVVVEATQTRPGVFEVRPDTLSPQSLANGRAEVNAHNDAPAGSNAPTREEAAAREASTAAATPTSTTPVEGTPKPGPSRFSNF